MKVTTKTMTMIVIVILLLYPLMGPASAQTGEATIGYTRFGSDSLDVSLYLQRGPGPAWDLGYATFAFAYNGAALAFGREVVEGIWDDNTLPGIYGDQISVSYGAAIRSIEIDYATTTAGAGTQVPLGPTLLGTLRFRILNFALPPNFVWNGASAVLDDFEADQTGNITFTNPDNQPLPITLASFTGHAMSNGVRLDWTTLTEVNNYGFEIEKSQMQATGYQMIPSSFIPGHGTTTDPHTYTYMDLTATSGTWYYRLKQTDLDGTVHYSEPILIQVLTSVKEVAPVAFALNQNYPNPFNPQSEIKFSVETTGRATLEVYNIAGELVATLFDGVAEAGQYYRVQFGSGMASGVYFYRLQTGTKSDLKKMLLLK